jgi:predicted transglutaminase-like cysteine proteinase
MLRFLICTLCATFSCAFSSATAATPIPPVGPAIFGTGMISVRTTPYDARWRGVASKTLGAAVSIAQTARPMDALEQIRFVNSAVNARISYKHDAADSWTSASKTFSLGAGDCEDYAIAKMQILQSGGLAASDLLTFQ